MNEPLFVRGTREYELTTPNDVYKMVQGTSLTLLFLLLLLLLLGVFE